MSFAAFNSDIILCSAETVLTFNYSTKKSLNVELPKLIINKNAKPHNNLEVETCHGITSVTISPDGQYYAICTNRKQLCLYKRSDNSLVSNRTLIRAAGRVHFTPGNDIIVADRSGDVYLYQTDSRSSKYKLDEQDQSAGSLILGHLSMLLDVLVTHNGDFIITADRDEKIRISRYPNAYNIESFCLGHTKFVSNISELPHNRNILVSAGGDGDFKLWDYKKGVELNSGCFNDKADEEDVKKLNRNLQQMNLSTEEVTAFPVKCLRLIKTTGTSSMLALSFYGNENILFYIISESSSELEIDFMQKIVALNEPLECLFHNQQFWTLFDDGLKVYRIQKGIFVEDVEFNKVLEELNQSWASMRSNVNELNFYPTLYKRKFDSVQEYQERKKSRLMHVE